jgi:7-carboxy-7-deazaguanine synthase
MILRVYAIFSSIQGESTSSGLPTTFIRLAGCPLKCSYCDTRLACEATGTSMTVDDVVVKVAEHGRRLVELTGGEPLAQESTFPLMTALADKGFDVMLETSGAFSIAAVDPRVRVIMDVKTPGSGMRDRMDMSNLDLLDSNRHELKFVITSRDDFDWATVLIQTRKLAGTCELLFSPASGRLGGEELARWILDANLPVRLQLQVHKILWPGEENK